MTEIEKYLLLLEEKDEIECEKNKCLASVSSMGVGGKADYFVVPKKTDVFVKLLEKLRVLGTPFQVVGNSTNIIYSDGGFRGVIVCTKGLNKVTVQRYADRVEILAECGVMLPTLSRVALNEAVGGFEGLSSVPGTVGGAIPTNAGAYGNSISDCLLGMFIYTYDGRLCFRRNDKTMFSYRKCNALVGGDAVVSAVFSSEYSDKLEISNRIKEYSERRRISQPIGEKSVGSYFKRPNIPEYSPFYGLSAGELIEKCGLKGISECGAIVSEKHGNFIINTGSASAKDVMRLAEKVKKTVFSKTGITLFEEPFFVGENQDLY